MSGHVLCTLLAFVVSVIALVTMLGSDATAGDTAASDSRQRTVTEVNMVEAEPTSEAELTNQPEGRSEPEGSESMPGETGNQTPRQVPPSMRMVYVNPTYGFSIGYPNGFVVQPQDVSRLTQFTPKPVESIFFMNPTMAGGALAGIEPPDLEVRVYQAGAVDSLKTWLVSVGFAAVDSGAVTLPYRNDSVSGLRVCQSTLIAPGCSVYVLRSGRVYQLSAISLEGEAMIETFVLPPLH